ncbi:MAG: hypothetical protein ACLFR7_07905 [Opitutales bacterium]
MAAKPPQEPLTQIAGGSLLRPEAQYLGEHALLAVTGFYKQRYRRFAYRDIEALIIQPTSHQTAWTVGLAIALVVGLLMLGLGSGGVVRVVGSIVSAASVVGLVVNLAMGPTCRTFLQSRVQRLRLGNVTRRTKAERLRAALWPRLEAVQGRVSAAEVRAWADALQRAREAAAAERRAAGRVPARGATPPTSDGVPPPAEPRVEKGPGAPEPSSGAASS